MQSGLVNSYDAVLRTFALDLEGAVDMNVAMDILQGASAQLGLPLVDYANMRAARRLDGTWVPPHMWTRKFPKHWDRNYDKHRPHDPYFHACFNNAIVVDWADVQRDLDILKKQERECLNYISDLGFGRGLTVPIHGPGSKFAYVSFMGELNSQGHEPFGDGLKNRVFLLAHYFHSSVRTRLAVPELGDLKDLSQREAECLAWAAAGKGVNDIAAILALSPETVRVYLKRSIWKLQALNRAHAVAKAVYLGLIDPPANMEPCAMVQRRRASAHCKGRPSD